MKILFISTRVPLPSTSGDTLIIYNRLARMSKGHDISLVMFYRKKKELEVLKDLEEFCEDIWPIKISRFDGFINLIKNLFVSMDPVQAMYYDSKLVKNQVHSIVNDNEFDLINSFLIRTIPIIKDLNSNIVLDMIDSMQLNFSNRLKNSKSILKSQFYKFEYERLVKFESKIPSNVKKAIFVSERDSCITQINSSVVPLGVNTDIFFPSAVQRKCIIFSGNMSYEPNIQAVIWFVENCLERILEVVNDVQFIIAGKDPHHQIKKMSSKNIIVTGYVDSIAELLSTSSVSVAPMISGSGMQNKVLEGMSCGVPVVTTPYGVGDIKVRHMKEVIIAEEPEIFSEFVIDILLSPEKYKSLSSNAREYVKKNNSWESHCNAVDKIYRLAAKSHKQSLIASI
jgi:polysaccharide biosynthesis protein PslH